MPSTHIKPMALASGVLLLGAVTYLQVSQSATQQAPVIIAFGVALAVGALSIGKAFSSAKMLGILLVLCMSSGELYSLFVTAEKTIVSRDIVSAPLEAAAAIRSTASKRLQDALVSADKAKTAVTDSAALSGCRVQCSALLSAAVTKADKEVVAARSALEALPVAARSVSPLADRLGVSGAFLDIMLASLFSFSTAALASVLIAFGGHTNSSAKLSDADHVGSFLLDTIAPSKGSAVSATQLESKYIAWTVQQSVKPLPYDNFKLALTSLLLTSGLIVTADGVMNVALRTTA
jgi:hypothetical protein